MGNNISGIKDESLKTILTEIEIKNFFNMMKRVLLLRETETTEEENEIEKLNDDPIFKRIIDLLNQLESEEEQFEIFIENGHSKERENQGKEPLLPLEGGESRAGILDIGQLQQSRDKGNIGVQLDIGYREPFGDLIRHHNSGREQTVQGKLHGHVSLKQAVIPSQRARWRGNPPVISETLGDRHTSDIGHWFAMTAFTFLSSRLSRIPY